MFSSLSPPGETTVQEAHLPHVAIQPLLHLLKILKTGLFAVLQAAVPSY